MEPVLKKHVKAKFQDLFETGRYGCRLQLTKAGIMRMCKDARLCKYKENWKNILAMLKKSQYDPLYNFAVPSSELLDGCISMFKRISRKFDALDKQSIFNLLKGSKGKPRHHMLHVNYVHNKILEANDVYIFHREFPLLRTPSKIHALDDVMQIICHQLHIPFNRTAVLQVPKCKHKEKSCKRVFLEGTK